MSGPPPWQDPAGVRGNLACARAAAGESRCWAASIDGRPLPPQPQRCRAPADCLDAQLAGCGFDWPRGSILRLDPGAASGATPPDPYVIDVLRADTTLLASFVCPLEAVRFAALLHEPGCEPLLRRRHDGQVRSFSPATTAPHVLRWLAAHD